MYMEMVLMSASVCYLAINSKFGGLASLKYYRNPPMSYVLLGIMIIQSLKEVSKI